MMKIISTSSTLPIRAAHGSILRSIPTGDVRCRHSIVIDSNDSVHISYRDNSNTDLKIAEINYDSDGDGVFDAVDSCLNGDTNWTSVVTNDYDGDGCQDGTSEEVDNDNDGILDDDDECPQGNLGWTSTTSTDWDSDGCQSSIEDNDDDNDSVLEIISSKHTSEMRVISYHGFHGISQFMEIMTQMGFQMLPTIAHRW